MPFTIGNITRCDVRIPNNIYERIEALAVRNKARINHKSGKPEVSPIILELLEIGLNFYDKYDSDKVSDTVSDKVSDKVSDTVSDKVITELSDRIAAIEIGIEREVYVNDRVINLESEVERLATTLEHFQTELEILETTSKPPTQDSLETNSDRLSELETKVQRISQALDDMTDIGALAVNRYSELYSLYSGLKKSLDKTLSENDDREKDGLTSRELARRLGKHPSTVLRWREREGGRDPLGRWVYKPSMKKWFSL